MSFIEERKRLQEVCNGKVFYQNGTVKFKTHDGMTGYMVGAIPSTLVIECEITGNEAESLMAVAGRVKKNNEWQTVGGYTACHVTGTDQYLQERGHVVLYPGRNQ